MALEAFHFPELYLLLGGVAALYVTGTSLQRTLKAVAHPACGALPTWRALTAALIGGLLSILSFALGAALLWHLAKCVQQGGG
jgi:hypothetical protein